jgi:small conductance mechanosensitive channel
MKEWLEAWGLGESTIQMLVDYGVKVGGAFCILYLASLAGKMVRRNIIRRAPERFDPSLVKFGGQIARWTVLLLGFLACLSLFGIETTSFAAVIGGASVAIGLALQGSLSHVASGVMLLIFRPFTVGDVVRAAGNTGKVIEIGLFSVTLETVDRRQIIIPNGKVFGDTIENITRSPTRRVDVAVGTDYDANIDATRKVLVDAAAKLGSLIVEGEEPVAYLDSLGGSSVDWSVRVVCKTEEFWSVRSQLTQLVKDALDEAGIGIPYPHTVIINQGE